MPDSQLLHYGFEHIALNVNRVSIVLLVCAALPIYQSNDY